MSFCLLAEDLLGRMIARATADHMYDNILLEEEQVGFQLVTWFIGHVARGARGLTWLGPFQALPTCVGDLWQ